MRFPRNSAARVEEDESEDEALPHPYKRADKCLRVELRPGDLEKRRRGREGSEGEVEEQLSYCCCLR